MKKTNKIILSCALILTLISTLHFSLFTFHSDVAQAASTPALHLQSPSHLAVLGEDIYIYDEETNNIILRSKATPSSGEELPIKAALEVLNVMAMEATESGLIALTKTNNNVSIILVSSDLQTTTPLTLSLNTYPISYVIDLSYHNGTLYLLKNNGEIDKFSLEGNTLTLNQGTITKTTLGEELATQTISQISHQDDVMYILADHGVYKVTPSTNASTKVIESNSIISLSYEGESAYALSSSGKLLTLTNGEQTELDLSNYSFTSLTSSATNEIYLSSPNTHQVFTYTSGSPKDLLINETITPTMFEVSDFRYLTLTSKTSLFLQPYSVTPKLEVEANSHLTIIGEAPTGYDFYYVLYTTKNQNYYLYLNKGGTNFTELEISSTLSSYVAIRRIYVYFCPSTTSDALNTKLQSISAQTTIKANSEVVVSGVETYYRVALEDGTYGFVPSSGIQPLKSAVELTLKCNAKTKRVTSLTENPDGTGEIISLSKNTRVYLHEELAPNKTYIKASYEDSNGITYSGYLFSEDLDPDGLSTLQILGIILIIVNILVLILIILIKIRSKKWKTIPKTN